MYIHERTMNRTDILISDIRAAASASGLTIPGIADLCGLHKNTVQKMGTCAFNPNAATLRKLENGLLAPARSA
jgi:hypothetical protein